MVVVVVVVVVVVAATCLLPLLLPSLLMSLAGFYTLNNEYFVGSPTSPSLPPSLFRRTSFSPYSPISI